MALQPARQQALTTQLNALATSLRGEELLWASGYFAGLAADADRTAPQADTALAGAAAAPLLTIWYGTETGNGRGVAQRLADAAGTRGYRVELASLADVQPRQIARIRLLVLVVSTHGEGDPPEDAAAFHKLITSDRAPPLTQLSYTVFALGDSSYPDFCQTGRELDEALSGHGATRVLERVDVDVDFEPAEQTWRERLLDSVRPLLRMEDAATPRLQVVREPAAAPPVRHDRANPWQAEVLEVSPLTVAPSRKSVHHLALSLAGSGLTCQPGDSLGFRPCNDPRLVDEVLELAGVDGAQRVVRDGRELPVETWLSRHLELTRIVRPFVTAYAEQAGAGRLADRLGDRDGFAAWAATRQVPDVLREYPARLEAEALVGMLRGIAPRLYSIASSTAAEPDEVHLTVRLEGGTADDERLRAGAASWQLTRTLRPGDSVPVYIEPNPRFRLPDDGERPVIMIGPGTGVAPFRAFLQHRHALGHGGRNWLFFGEQHRRTDFLYQLEWQRALREGLLTRLSVAFSRDQAEKVYVQHRLLEHGSAVYTWLRDGAHVYVCGSGQGMADDVHRTLAAIAIRHGGHTPEQAEEWLSGLRADGRYQKDVY